jgi:hypothetical protein
VDAVSGWTYTTLSCVVHPSAGALTDQEQFCERKSVGEIGDNRKILLLIGFEIDGKCVRHFSDRALECWRCEMAVAARVWLSNPIPKQAGSHGMPQSLPLLETFLGCFTSSGHGARGTSRRLANGRADCIVGSR